MLNRNGTIGKVNLTTQQGNSASILGLAAYSQTDANCVSTAFNSGINYFFFYNLKNESFLDGLKSLLAVQKEQILVATGSEERDLDNLRQYLEKVRQRLQIDVVDVFFSEYVSPSDDRDRTQAMLDEFRDWKAKGLIRYVGITTHNRAIALELIDNEACDVLMHRYNMAHRKAEKDVFPSAIEAKIPVVAFTCTRWGSLLKGHPNWQHQPPTAADCYRYALHNQAISLALSAPQSLQQLRENLSVLNAPSLSPTEIAHWQKYGDLIYGSGQDSFETQWT
jgi:aryl-alcohol dehydrogenase-like predicted oxidoreductase